MATEIVIDSGLLPAGSGTVNSSLKEEESENVPEHVEKEVSVNKAEPEVLIEGFVCRHEHFCRLCNENIARGTHIYPIRPEDDMNSRDWVHYTCASQAGILEDMSMRPVCKHWARLGKCLFKDTCFFAHPEEAACTIKSRRTWGGRRVAVRNDGRANEFRRFIVRNFGIENLSQGSGVLDIAGGKGELTFLLENLNGIKSTCIEPRSLKLRKFVRRFKFGMFHRTQTVSGRSVTRDFREGVKKCEQIRMCFKDEMIQAIVKNESETLNSLVEEAIEESKHLAWSSKGLGANEHEDGHEDEIDFESRHKRKGTRKEKSLPDLNQLENENGEPEMTEAQLKHDQENKAAVCEVNDITGIAETLRNASAVVGMHPDQATGAIVDLALALNVPFAVVPCCVYHKLFPERRLRDGGEVNDYDALIQYLVEKDPDNIKVETLDFEGKNKVVYSLGGTRCNG